MRLRRDTTAKETNDNNNKTWLYVIGVIVTILILVFLAFGSNNSYKRTTRVYATDAIGEITSSKMAIPIKDGTVSINGGNIFYCKANGNDDTLPQILLLHASMFSSSTWKGLGVLNNFGSYGYTIIAIDLPGYGLSNSVDKPVSKDGRLNFINNVVESLKLDNIVIVCPQKSGEYCIPLLMNAKNEKIKFNLLGMVLIEPKGTNEGYSTLDYQKLDIPTLNIYGELYQKESVITANKMLGESPANTDVVMLNLGKAPYTQNPSKFNEELMRFIRSDNITDQIDEDQYVNGIFNNDNDNENSYDDSYDDSSYNNNYYYNDDSDESDINNGINPRAQSELDQFDKEQQDRNKDLLEFRRDVTDFDDDSDDDSDDGSDDDSDDDSDDKIVHESKDSAGFGSVLHNMLWKSEN